MIYIKKENISFREKQNKRKIYNQTFLNKKKRRKLTKDQPAMMMMTYFLFNEILAKKHLSLFPFSLTLKQMNEQAKTTKTIIYITNGFLHVNKMTF